MAETDPVEEYIRSVYDSYDEYRGLLPAVLIVMPDGLRCVVPPLPEHIKPLLRGPVPKDLHDYGTSLQVYYHKDCTRIF
jgi:hypothetical protein